MELSFAAATDIGKQRSHNEDNFLIDKKLQLFLVADGMGGHAAGEVASSIAVHEIRDAVYARRDVIERYRVDSPEVAPAELLQILENAVGAACAAIHGRAQAEADKRGMGTTATVLLVAGSGDQLRGFIAHVGDSRVYLARGGEAHMLTEDHSLLGELLRRGKITKEQLDAPPYKKFKNAVTRAVGIYASVAVDTFDFDILPGDQFLLCSDGLHAYLEHENIAALLSSGEVREVPANLVALANRGGGHDNITGVVVRVAESNDETTTYSAEVSQKLDVLKQTQLFRYMTYKELVRVVSVAKEVHAPAAAVLFNEGDTGDSMYIVIAGNVSLRKGNAEVSTVGVGEHFGEMALVDRSQRSLSAFAESASRLIEISRADFFDIVRRDPPIAVKMLWSLVQVLGVRLRKTTKDLGDALNDRAANDTIAEILFGE